MDDDHDEHDDNMNVMIDLILNVDLESSPLNPTATIMTTTTT